MVLRENVKEVLIDEKNIALKVSFHSKVGDKLEAATGGPKNKKTFSRISADVKIIRYADYNSFSKSYSEKWVLYVDGEVIGKVDSYKKTNNSIRVKSLV